MMTDVSRSGSAALFCLALTAACAGSNPAVVDGGALADSSGGDATASRPVVELALRRLGASQELTGFEGARDAFVARLRAQPGVEADREFRAVFDYGSNGPPMPQVFVGMTQYRSLDAFRAAGASLGTSSEATSFFATFQPITFTALRPLDERAPVNLRGLASEPGQVLEIAVRDFSRYTSFNPDAYARARDGFLTLLRAQPGVIAEYQWLSALDPNLAVGMTVYASQQAFQTLATSPALTQSPATAAFLGAYPPAHGFVVTSVR
jgi:hypothetical protein